MARTLQVLVCVIGLSLAACGGNDDDAPSREEFANRAEEICRDAEKQIEQIGEGAESPEEVSDAIDKAIDRSRDAADELVDLERPDGADGETAGEFVDGFKQEFEEKLVPVLEDLGSAAKRNDAQAVQAAAAKLQQLENTESDSAAREIGADACVG